MTGRDDFSELISAFLDGEVTPEEQALVEERLVDSAEDRRLFEEMRAIRNGLQALPRRELGKDLSESILRRAERTMLSAGSSEPGRQDDPSEALKEDRDRREAAIVATSPMPRQRGSWRALVWFGVTVAAVVLIMCLRPWFEPSRRVVKLDTGDAADVAAREAAESAAGDQAIPEVAAMKLTDNAASDSSAAPAKGVDRAKEIRLGAAEGSSAGLTPMRKAGKSFEEFARSVAKSPEEAEVRAEQSADAGPGGVESLARRAYGQPAFSRPTAQWRGARSDGKIMDQLARLDIPTDRLLVVSLDVAATAVHDGRLDEALARNSVSYKYATEQLVGEQGGIVAQDKRERAEADDFASPVLAGRSKQQTQWSLAGDGDVVVLAQASEKQVRAALTDLARRQDTFQIVSMHAVPATNELEEVVQRLDTAVKKEAARPPAPREPGLPADAETAATDEELAEATPSAGGLRGPAEEMKAGPAPADAPTAPAPQAIPKPGKAVLGEGVRAPIERDGAVPDAPAEREAKRLSSPAFAAPAVPPLAEVPERPAPRDEPGEEPAAQLQPAEESDEAAVTPAEPEPLGSEDRAFGVKRRTRKKADASEGRADAEGDADKKLQAKTEGMGGAQSAATPASDLNSQYQKEKGTEPDPGLQQRRESGQRREVLPREDGPPTPTKAKGGELVPKTRGSEAAGTLGRGGGWGAGSAGIPPVLADSAPGGSAADEGQQVQPKFATAPRSAAPPKLVQVLFVLRAVGSPANIAADVHLREPPTAAMRAEIEAAAESAEAEVDAVAAPAAEAARD
jgi:hypothetical protein